MIGDKECLNCGKELINTPKKRVKVFCNNTCRSNYWQKSDRLEKEGKTIEQIVSILSNHKKQDKKKKTNFRKVIAETPKEVKEMVAKQMDELDAMANQLAAYESEIATLPDIGLGKKRRQFLQSKISELKRQLK